MAAVKARIAAAHSGLRIGQHRAGAQWAQVNYGPVEDQPLVSIIVPTKNRLDMLKPCIDSLLHITRYRNFEILIVDNGSDDPKHADYCIAAQERDSRVRLLKWPQAYNWSALNNWAADFAKGEFLCLLNDDTRILGEEWLDEMIGCAMREGVGAVGARLLYPHGMVQHVGVVSSGGLTGHIHKGLPESAPGYNGIAVLSHESTAVTGACLVIRKSLYVEAGKMDERLAHNFNDVAMCLKLRKMGYRNVLVASAQLHHLEGQTRTRGDTTEGLDLIKAEGALLRSMHPELEPYWNPNLLFVHHQGGALVSGMNYDLFCWPAPLWPWRGDDWKSERILAIGDDETVYRTESQEGNSVYLAAVEGFSMRISQPPVQNLHPWDIRYPESAREIFERLAIQRIVVRSIVGMPVEILAFLLRLGLPLDYRPVLPEAACPRLSFTTDDKQDCGKGWRDDLCQNCIDINGSAFGQISIVGWRYQWARFLKAAQVDLSALNDQARTAIDELYGDGAAAGRKPVATAL